MSVRLSIPGIAAPPQLPPGRGRSGVRLQAGGGQTSVPVGGGAMWRRGLDPSGPHWPVSSAADTDDKEERHERSYAQRI